jgi:hypothetical protein
MAIRLNQRGIEYAQERIRAGEVDHLKEPWSEHQATEDEKDKYLQTHYIAEYGQWFLGENTDYIDGGGQERYVYPHGNLGLVHISALRVAEQQARENGHTEIADAARQLLELAERTSGLEH